MLKKFQCLCAVRLGLIVLGEGSEPSIRVLLVADATKIHLPHAKPRGCVGVLPTACAGSFLQQELLCHEHSALQKLCPECLSAGKCWAPSVGASKINGSLIISIAPACAGEKDFWQMLCVWSLVFFFYY